MQRKIAHLTPNSRETTDQEKTAPLTHLTQNSQVLHLHASRIHSHAIIVLAKIFKNDAKMATVILASKLTIFILKLSSHTNRSLTKNIGRLQLTCN